MNHRSALPAAAHRESMSWRWLVLPVLSYALAVSLVTWFSYRPQPGAGLEHQHAAPATEEPAATRAHGA
jgi:hypothetical protein